MPIYLFIKKAIEKRSYYSDTPGKFALLKELKRNFLQIFVVDSSCFCNFVAENERFIVQINRVIIPLIVGKRQFRAFLIFPTMVVAYLRVSTGRQTLTNQRHEITRFAGSRNMVVDCWVTEVVSGSKKRRDRKLGATVKRLKAGDTLIVTELSRLSRTLTDIMTIVGELLEKGVFLYSTKDRYSFDDTINSKVLCFAFGLVAEIERNLISARTKEALAARREQGVILGRRRGSYTKLQRLIDAGEEIAGLLNDGRTIAMICGRYGVARNTFDRFRALFLQATVIEGKRNYSFDPDIRINK